MQTVLNLNIVVNLTKQPTLVIKLCSEAYT